MALQECHDFELVRWQTTRIKVFGVPRVGNTNSYKMRTGRVMLVDVDDKY